MDKKKNRPPKEKAHVIKNTLFILGCGLKSAPLAMISLYISNIIENVYYSLVFSVFFLKTALSVIEGNGTFKELVIKIVLMVIGKVFVDMMGYFTNFYAKIRFEIKCEGYINEMIFNKAKQVELGCYENPEFFDKYNRATWVIEKGGFKRIVQGTSWVIGSIISLIVMVIYLVSIDPVMIIFIICPVFVTFFRVLKHREEFRKEKETTPYERQKEYVRRTVLLKDFAKEIKTTNIFAVLKKRFSSAIENNIKLIKKYGLRVAVLEVLSDLFGDVIPVAGGFGYGCYRLVELGNLPVSDFSVLVSAILQCRFKINNFARYFTMQQKHCLWVQSLQEFLAYEPKIVDGGIDTEEMETLEFRNVSFTYPGKDEETLKNISFKVNKGETVAIVGHNGAGKTTLSKLLMRLYDVTEGEILYNGKNIKEYNLLSYRDRFASVFQDYRIFAMTVAENVLMQETDENNIPLAEKALTQSGVMNKIETLPEGVNTLLTKEFDDEGASLSGGETQKLAIARLFAKQFDVAVLDEPSSALDPVAESKMYDALAEGTKDKTVLYISHRLSSAANADNILVFRDGQLIETGNHAELMAKGGEYCEMFTLQASGYREEESQDEAE